LVLLFHRFKGRLAEVDLGLQLAVLIDQLVYLFLELAGNLFDAQTGDLVLVLLAQS
jgi:hypothetical protein